MLQRSGRSTFWKAGRRLLQFAILGSVVAIVIWAVARSVAGIWTLFENADPTLSAAILTAASTVIVSTLAIVLGRYFERKKDIEAAYREKKTEIYDTFLQELFKIFYGIEKSGAKPEEIVGFLRDWQRKIILWGGQGVIRAYLKWMQKLKRDGSEPDAQSVLLADEFFRAMRKDLGHSNLLLAKGTFIHFLLREADLFFVVSKNNPSVKLSTLAELEKQIVKPAVVNDPSKPA